MPAFSVIRRMRALSGFIGLKDLHGFWLRRWAVRLGAQPGMRAKLHVLQSTRAKFPRQIHGVAVKCIDIIQNLIEGGATVIYRLFGWRGYQAD